MTGNKHAATIRNGALSPKVSAVNADTIGPAVNPATLALTMRPRFLPIRSGSESIKMRRSAGSEIPTPKPVSSRPTSNGRNAWPNAINNVPTISITMPVMTSFFEWPLSARGAKNICDRNPVRKPIPTMIPNFDSAILNSSRKSSNTVNITP